MTRTQARRLRGGAGCLFAPFAAGVTLLLVVPALLNGYYAFTDHTGLAAPNFNGLTNLRRLFSDPFVADALRASLAYAVMAVPLRMFAATALGIALAQPRRGSKLYRVVIYLPTVIPDIALAVLFLWVFNPLYGPVNQVLGAVGAPTPNWLATPWGARWAIVLMMLFPIGEAFLVVMASRRELDPAMYEAAAMDGASPSQMLRHLTLPIMAPLLLLLVIRDTILTLQVNFVPAYVLTDGGPDNATLFLPVYIFDQAFEFLGFGYAAMLTLLLLTITTLLLLAEAVVARRLGVLRR